MQGFDRIKPTLLIIFLTKLGVAVLELLIKYHLLKLQLKKQNLNFTVKRAK